MLGQLLESSPRRVRRRFSTMLSIVAHVAIGGAAVAAARPVPEEPPIRTVITWHPPAPPSPHECTSCGSGRAGAAHGRSRDGRVAFPDMTDPQLSIDVGESADPIGENLTISPEELLGTRGGAPAESALPLSAGAVDREVVAFATNPVPRYPGHLRAAGIGGTVRVRFVVDTTGRVVMGTVVVESADHPLFAEAVIDALKRSRFTPAELGGRKVAQLVVQPFAFVIRQ